MQEAQTDAIRRLVWLPIGMDAAYWERKAADERKRLDKHLKSRTDHERTASRAEAAAAKAAEAASRSTAAATIRSKQREAERKNKEALKATEKATKAGADAAASQKKISEYEQKARTESSRAAKKEAERRKRDERLRAAEERRAERERARLEEARSREVQQLRAQTFEVQAQLAAAQRAAPKQITVLLMAGTPEGGELPLRLDREIREIDHKIRFGEYRDQIRFEQTQATQVSDIIDALNRFDPEVVHFSGHSSGSSLLFEDRDGTAHALRGEDLALLLQVAREEIRLVVFNACDSADQASLATEFVDVAIGMDASIGDETAKVFAGQFYGSLAAGNSVASAFAQAQAQSTVIADGSGEPRLFTREGVDANAMAVVSP
jgi:hypothetical protein